MKSKCPSCGKNPAQINPTYGILPCQTCQDAAEEISTINYREFTSPSVKRDREERAISMLQPYHGGHLSKEYVDAHGTDKLDVSKKDIKNAKEVYKGKIKRHHKIADSKL